MSIQKDVFSVFLSFLFYLKEKEKYPFVYADSAAPEQTPRFLTYIQGLHCLSMSLL